MMMVMGYLYFDIPLKLHLKGAIQEKVTIVLVSLNGPLNESSIGVSLIYFC